jgi:hypothetical protein
MDKLHELHSYNSLYIWCNSLLDSIAIQSKQLISTIMQLHYNYNHYVILTSLIVIHILKSNMWHYEKF